MGRVVRGSEDFEWYDLEGVGVIVNVTDIEEISRVTKRMAQDWTWDGVSVDWTPEQEGEVPTEWICLRGAQRRPQSLAS